MHKCKHLTISQRKRWELGDTDVKALVCGKELGHGAQGNSIGTVLLQRGSSFTHQQTRGHQPCGHFCQFELKKLQRQNQSWRRRCHGMIPKWNSGSLLTWLLERVSPNCLRTNRCSLASCTEACAAPREHEAGSRVSNWNLLMDDHTVSPTIRDGRQGKDFLFSKGGYGIMIND